MILLGNDLPGPLPTGQVSGVLDRTFWRLFLVDSARIIDLFCHQGEDGWEDVDDDEAEGIEVSGGSPFAPASEYFGETFIIWTNGKNPAICADTAMTVNYVKNRV